MASTIVSASFASTQVAQVGATGRRTLAVLPSAKHKQQKIAVGDDTGVVTCFTAKKGVHEVSFLLACLLHAELRSLYVYSVSAPKPLYDVKFNFFVFLIPSCLQLVFQSNPGEREVTALCLGGPKADKSQIYVAHGQIIHGYQKKVALQVEFGFEFITNMRFELCRAVVVFTCASVFFASGSHSSGQGLFQIQHVAHRAREQHVCRRPQDLDGGRVHFQHV